MKAGFPRILLHLSACLLSISWMAHGQQTGPESIRELVLEQTSWPVAGRVTTAQGGAVRGVTVVVTPLDAGGSRTLATDAKGEFRTEYVLNVKQVPEFRVTITATKKGFSTAHAFADYDTPGKSRMLSLTLRGRDEDPALLSPGDLISALAPKLKQARPAEGLAEKSEKEYAQGVADFLDHHNPTQAVPLLAKVVKSNPSCIGCRTMLGLAEVGWRDWDDAKEAFTAGVNATRQDQKMGRPEPLVAYGTWVSWQHEPDKAEPFFQEALKYAPEDALALQELGRALVSMQKFEAANDVLKRALAAGAGPEARLLYAQSCLGMDRTDEATAELNRYLDGRDVKKMPLRVREVWASIQSQQKVEATYAKPQKSHDVVDFVQHAPADLTPGLEPATDQQQLGPILDAVGAKIVELIKNFPNTSSLERIHQEKLGGKGGGLNQQSQKFRYLCLVPAEAWGPSFVEYRADLAGKETSPVGLSEGFMLTQGFASAPFIFHPTYRSGSTFRYLGRQNVNGRNTYVVAFAQIPAKAHIYGVFLRGQTSITTYSQGLAWIDADTYQIIRMHTDLLAPIPEFRLAKQTLDIDFNAVHFTTVKDALWLPGKVTVTLDWNGKILRNQHEYSDFKIFQVAATEKIGKPKNSRASSKETPEPTVSQ